MSKEEAKDIPLRELVRNCLTRLEEQKKDTDDLYRMMSAIQGDMKVYNVEHKNQSQYIIDNAKKIIDIEKEIEDYVAERNMIIGATKFGAWLGGIGGVGGIGALIVSYFKH